MYFSIQVPKFYETPKYQDDQRFSEYCSMPYGIQRRQYAFFLNGSDQFNIETGNQNRYAMRTCGVR